MNTVGKRRPWIAGSCPAMTKVGPEIVFNDNISARGKDRRHEME
jgi:hypothetical protein